MKTPVLPLLRGALCAVVLSLGSVASAAADSVELIPRKLLFGNPVRTSPQLSPDGTMLAFLAPRDGVMNLWVCPTGKLDEARPLTNETSRPIPYYQWLRNGEDLLYVQDTAGDENYLAYAVNAESGAVRKLTDFPKTRVRLIATSWKRPDEILVGLNNRDERWHDAWLLNVKSGKLTLVHENKDNLSGYVADEDFRLRFALRSRPDGGREMLKFDENHALEVVSVVSYEDARNTRIAGMTEDGSTLYLLDSRGRDKAVLKAVDAASLKEQLLAESDKADVGDGIFDPVTGRIQAYSVNYLRNEWSPLDKSVAGDVQYLNENVSGEWYQASATKDDQVWLIGRSDATAPGAYYVYDRRKKALAKLFSARPDLEGRPLVAMHPLELKARDGLTLVSYLSLPHGSDADGNARPEKPLPLVLLVHGGPWARDDYGFDRMHQWLANRGYAVLSVNFRGSTGFGKGFISAGDKEWAGKMHEDLLDAVSWAVAEGIAPKDRIAIMGGSYGGYATLVGLSFTPDVFACGVDIVGPSNLETLLSTIPPYWESVRTVFARAIGDLNTEEGRRLLAERSPLTRASAIKKPLLIGQGANDPRVKQAESDQIVSAMKEKNIPVTYVLYPDEGHGFARPENNLSFNAVTEAFLAECLGGRYEPIGTDFAGASIQVPHGASQVPGLADALKGAPGRNP